LPVWTTTIVQSREAASIDALVEKVFQRVEARMKAAEVLAK
jgi:hypothetical protein